MILFQLLVNVGMVTGVMPVTGVPLPFVTYGGSSLIALLFGLGILQSIRMREQQARALGQMRLGLGRRLVGGWGGSSVSTGSNARAP